MIERHPDVPDNIVELERHETIEAYARRYRSELASLYEDLKLIVFPHFPLNIDLKLFQSLTFPKAASKIGSHDGIDEGIIIRRGDKLAVNQNHVLVRLTDDVNLASYIQTQIASVDAQVREAIRILFPKYLSLERINQTWRFSKTEDIGLHFDYYGTAYETRTRKDRHRLKFFINLDTQPRQWITSFTLPGALHHFRSEMPGTLPDDINSINHIMVERKVFTDTPYHRVNFPTLSAVFGNGEALSHGVIFGQRMIGGEFACRSDDMLDPHKNTSTQLPHWLNDAGYKIES